MSSLRKSSAKSKPHSLPGPKVLYPEPLSKPEKIPSVLSRSKSQNGTNTGCPMLRRGRTSNTTEIRRTGVISATRSRRARAQVCTSRCQVWQRTEASRQRRSRQPKPARRTSCSKQRDCGMVVVEMEKKFSRTLAQTLPQLCESWCGVLATPFSWIGRAAAAARVSLVFLTIVL